jgi:hypothetical protein
MIRYSYDTHVEQPAKSCQEKPWRGLVAQVDKVLLPSVGCKKHHHTPASCDCNRDVYKLPIQYGSRYEMQFIEPENLPFSSSNGDKASVRIKRDAPAEKVTRKRLRDLKLPTFKSLKEIISKEPNELASPLKVKLNLEKRSNVRVDNDNLRLKRKNESPCAYTYESCDPRKHNKHGCPLCYRCNCEPVTKQTADQKFSPYDVKIPYKVVTHEEAPGKAPMNQEFDFEPPSYTGLKQQDMYKKYIGQIMSKYPEHMARRMPDMQKQQQDLLKFISELSRSDKSPGDKIDNEDVRYKIVDNAMDMFKQYEKALNVLPKAQKEVNGKFLKRGAAMEVVEVNPETFNSGTYKVYEDPSSA